MWVYCVVWVYREVERSVGLSWSAVWVYREAECSVGLS